MILDLLLIAGGLVGLFAGGESLVRGSLGLAQRLGLSPMLIGLTVVGFGTSMPELLVSLDAALRGAPEIAIGNIVGSNIANILLIVGVAAVVWPIRPDGPPPRRDLLAMLAAAMVLLPVFAWGMVTRPMGAALMAGLALYLWAAFRDPDGKVAAVAGSVPPPVLGALLRVGVGLVALVVGARLLVDGSISLARAAGLSEAFIGLSIVAVGTSLPELATSLVAALRRQSAIAIGNVVGSNIFNVLGILGATALITPVPVAARFLAFDWPVMLAASLALAGLVALRPAIGRPAGVLLLVAYAAYLWVGQG
jgi:cation:H+ antiporter